PSSTTAAKCWGAPGVPAWQPPDRTDHLYRCVRSRAPAGANPVWARRGRVSAAHDQVRLHAAERARATSPAGGGRGGGRARGVRLRRLLRPLLPVADRTGPLAVRVVGAGGGRPGHLPGGPDVVGHLPDPALPPGGGGAEGGHHGSALRLP